MTHEATIRVPRGLPAVMSAENPTKTNKDAVYHFNKLACEKGHFFLRLVEETVGPERRDAYLRDYFERNAFRSMTTERFVAAFEKVEEQVSAFQKGAKASNPKTKKCGRRTNGFIFSGTFRSR